MLAFLRCEHRDLTEPDLRARAAELQHRIDETRDEIDANTPADELHALLDDVANGSGVCQLNLTAPLLGFRSCAATKANGYRA